MVYSYTVPEDKWTKLHKCKYIYENFAMAVIKDQLTTIGGWDFQWTITNILLTTSGSSWSEVLPPMPTYRMNPAVANTCTHLVVAGGRKSLRGVSLTEVDVLKVETLQWSSIAHCLPEGMDLPQIQINCDGHFYLASRNRLFSCSVEDLFKSTSA